MCRLKTPLEQVFQGAFNLQAAGGGTLGYGISQSLTWGFKRGAFLNEAGLGSAVMVNSSANVKEHAPHALLDGFFHVAVTMTAGKTGLRLWLMP